MKRFLFIALIIPNVLQAQWHVNVFGGISNYSGDLQEKFFTTSQSFGAFGLGLQYDVDPRISVLTGIDYAQVGASDKFNKPILQARNLSFQTQIFEWNLLGEYNFLDLSKSRFTPYVFAGVAVFHFNPFAYDSLGTKVYLKPLSTEGEGLPQYPDRKPYSLIQMAIPFGGGIKLRVTDKVSIAYEIGFRKLFTDYLDDVSTTYVDKNILLSAKGPLAVAMAYRGGEIKNGNPVYPAAGTVRGNPKHKDWYYLTGIRISFAFDTYKNTTQKNRSGIIDCPRKVM